MSKVKRDEAMLFINNRILIINKMKNRDLIKKNYNYKNLIKN